MAVYTVSMADLTIVANATLVFVRAATAITSRGSLLEVLRVTVNQRSTGTSAQLGIILGQKAAAVGTYVAATPSPRALGGAASGIIGGTAGAAGTAGVNASAEGAGVVTNTISEAFNNLNGYLWVPTPRETLLVLPDIAFIVKLVGTPAVLTNWYAAVTFDDGLN